VGGGFGFYQEAEMIDMIIFFGENIKSVHRSNASIAMSMDMTIRRRR
jgi:hypothetical protein